MFRKAAREIAETKIAPKVAEMEETGEVREDVVKALAEGEMMAITIPEEYGGLGLGYTERLIAVEEISRVSVATGIMLQVFALGIEPIVKFGSDQLGVPEELLGLKGSPTIVCGLNPQEENKRQAEIITGTRDEKADMLVQKLVDAGVL